MLQLAESSLGICCCFAADLPNLNQGIKHLRGAAEAVTRCELSCQPGWCCCCRFKPQPHLQDICRSSWLTLVAPLHTLIASLLDTSCELAVSAVARGVVSIREVALSAAHRHAVKESWGRSRQGLFVQLLAKAAVWSS